MNTSTSRSALLDSLRSKYEGYDLKKDPTILYHLEMLKAGNTSAAQFEKAIQSGKTFCTEQLKSLRDKGVAMLDELGPSPTDCYLSGCIQKYLEASDIDDEQRFKCSSAEKTYLATILKGISILTDNDTLLSDMAPKVHSLIQLLVAESGPDFTGIVFIEQRVWVTALAQIISTDPRTRDVFNVGTFVGTSNSSKRRTNVIDMTEPPDQQTTLADFRAGKKNLILATSVLEEGIDVSNCHLVICFEPPKNLKSFIQRRGRARKQESKYIIFLSDGGDTSAPETWEALEEDMKRAYLDDMRNADVAEKREHQDETSTLTYRVSSTGYVFAPLFRFTKASGLANKYDPQLTKDQSSFDNR